MDIEREFDDEGAPSRDRDPVVPRGAVVAGEQRELEGAEDLPPTWFCPDCGGAVTWAAAIADLAIAKSDLRAAQERIRALEARLEELRPVVRAVLRNDRAENSWSDHIPEEWDEKSYEVDDELSAEVTASREAIVASIDALSPADREWAEGEET